MSLIPFTRWPDAFAERYRQAGYWLGKPLSHMLAVQAETQPEAIAVVCGERELSYAELDALSTNLAQRLANHGLGQGDRALVQLGNQAELYIVFFALLKAGIAPVNALFSHSRLELRAYAEQIRPRLLIASRLHPLFQNDDLFLAELQQLAGIDTALLHADGLAQRSLAAWLQPVAAAREFAPTPADEVAFFQLSGGSTGTPKLIPRTHDDYYYSVRRSVELCGFDRDTRYLCALPAAHNFPLSSPGALGVFDPGINALSILTKLLPSRAIVRAAQLHFPSNRQTPIAAELDLVTDDGAPIRAEFDWRQTGPQTWDIELETDAGRAVLSLGGSRLEVDGKLVHEGSEHEYPGLYRVFARLVREGRSDVDAEPLRVVADAFLLGARDQVEAFDE